MGSSSKSKYKEKDSSSSRPSKRRHASPNDEEHESHREKRHKHKHRHHRDKRRERTSKPDYNSDDSDVVEVVPTTEPVQNEPGESSGQGSESLSIEETNKLRAKLGLKPLEVSSSDSNVKSDGKKKDDLGEFYHKPAENLAEKAKREKIRTKLSEHREKRHLQTKYSKVKALGEGSDSDDDVSNWVHKNRKIDHAKKEAEKRAKMLEELDAQFGIGEVIEQEQRERKRKQYSEKDLKGLLIEHDVDTFAEEKDIILTLKDKAVLDEEDDDVLVNVNMIDNEKYKKNIENKTKKIHYNAYEDQEFDEFGNPKEKSLLSKYDEEISGQKRDGFRIGYDNAVERKQAIAQSVKEKLAKKKLETIAEKNLTLASEYFNEEELAKFKKPKKKVRKIRSKGKLTADDLLLHSQKLKSEEKPDFSIDDVPNVEIPTDIKLEDDKDDLLELALHKARKIKQKENLIADIIKLEVKEEPHDDNAESGYITLNSTAEFCRTLGDIPTYGKSGNRDEDEDMIDFEKEAMEDDEKSDDDCKIIESSGWNTVDPKNEGIDLSRIAPQEVQILDEEPDVSTGVGAALKLAMSKGYLDKEQDSRPSNSRLAHLQAQHYSIEDKNYTEENERGGGGGGRGRERYSGPIQDFREKDGFKPNVKLEYIDDDGHILNSKEAFRYLSHKFHGKGPGKNKVEKRIKKGVQEQLMKKMSSTDTPLGTLNMLQAKQKETQSAFVVLSGSKQQQATSISKTRR
ncbi:U4/U6.U5 tri-snRNP-associated protein 1 [Sitophilus oryzae]|uniref:U4/U6.U5 tri-snRNP-associated protein 1 n=1 Tax=Sitophilus oryzae TaxID=7048 RepID=A0A6J2YFD0_SITOR|nr:U4/U6.U5 tri-snRNP-associated protein 1 [Sitophilus oryzae]